MEAVGELVEDGGGATGLPLCLVRRKRACSSSYGEVLFIKGSDGRLPPDSKVTFYTSREGDVGWLDSRLHFSQHFSRA